MRSKLAIIGLGNWLLSDEGTGLHAIELLRNRLNQESTKLPITVDLVDAGTPGMNLLHQFDEREKIIFIDAGNCGLQPGQYRRFTPDQVFSIKKSNNFSLHEFDLIKFLEFAKQLDFTSHTEIVVYCMQAHTVEMSEKLSDTVRETLPLLVEDIINEIKCGDKKP